MEQLNYYLQDKIKELNGKWVSKNSGYEKEACVILGFNCETKRYWDSEYNGLYIEIKKGKSNTYCHEVKIHGPSTVMYGGNDKPLLSCGARVVMVTESDVEVLR